VSALKHFSPVRACIAAVMAALFVASPAMSVHSESAKPFVPSPVAQQSSLQADSKGMLMVIGDSIARAYDDEPGSVRQGFWSMLADEIDAQPKLAAQGGAGFVKPGLSRCKGKTFSEQLTRARIRHLVASAGAVIIEGGRNDTRTCHRRGFADVTTEQLRAAVDTFMDQVADLRAGSNGCTIVVTPWGPKGEKARSRITPVIRKAARSHGFDFIGTKGVLNQDNTIDGIHPQRAGNVALTQKILRRGFARTCFSSSQRRPDPRIEGYPTTSTQEVTRRS
jgi:lysophospholipase L1-like esterase